MLAYGTIKTSSAWKLYAKSQGVPFELANAVSEQIAKYENAVKHADEDSKDDIKIEDYIDNQYLEIFEHSAGYRGLITSWSIAPCAYLLYDKSIRKKIGLTRIKEAICACMDGHWAEECHFLKNDLLTVQVVNQIYATFHRIGMEPPSVNDLLTWTRNDTATWGLYHSGCTLCLNQVEKQGTSARVAAYKPSNISELCAFVAAIRPGFKSMYKTFESRQPFSYGVKAFDELIQTNEMPDSFVLYQEQEMAALNYAGIPMSECYTAIKNIAKKRVEKVLAYKGIFKEGFKQAMIEKDGKSEDEADNLAEKLWQLIEDSSSYSFNSSHSYCVALDSLYEAWLKAHYPLEFYEVALNIYEKKGDKDKMNALKLEAEDYFKISFPPLRYGQDNRAIKCDTESHAIVNSMASIKGYSVAIGRHLYECSTKLDNPTFFDVLGYLDAVSIKSAKVIPLIQIDYFQQFGNNATLLRLVDAWDFLKQGKMKSISKEKLGTTFTQLIKPYATDQGKGNKELKTWTIVNMHGLLNSIQTYIYDLQLPELTFRTRAKNQKDILGYVDMTTGKEEDRRKLMILEVYTITTKWNKSDPTAIWKYRLTTKSIGSGKVSQLSVSPKVMNTNKIIDGDIIYVHELSKDQKGYWNLWKYDILQE